MRHEKTFTMLLLISITLIVSRTPLATSNAGGPISPIIWAEERQLTFDPTYTYEDPETGKNVTEYLVDCDEAPSITATNDNQIWIAWHTDETQNNEIFYKVCNGTWSKDTRLTFNSHNDIGPALLRTTDDKIWVFWTSDRTGNNEIFYKFTSDKGTTWSIETQATDDPRSDISPAVIQASDGKIWLVWSRETAVDNEDLFYKTYNGAEWSNDTQLTTNPDLDQLPSITQSKDGQIWVFWSQYMQDTHTQICFKKTFNGSTWSSETQLTTDPIDNMDPTSFVDSDGTIWVFWQAREETGQVQFDLFYKTSSDNGTSWSSSVQFTTDREEDIQPSAFRAPDKSLWVIWTSTRRDSNGNDNVDLYRKSSLLGDINRDGIIDILDMDAIKRAMPTTPADPHGTGWNQWNPECDLNVDNVIDIEDLATASVNYGRQA